MSFRILQLIAQTVEKYIMAIANLLEQKKKLTLYSRVLLVTQVTSSETILKPEANTSWKSRFITHKSVKFIYI
uniref:Uncharacterized protein n=1 Tax=Octopus bimaculoides TaxID=37653 RepID=A0A0L8HMV7_OCTBM